MKKKHLDKKLQEFENLLKLFIKKRKDSVEDVHVLRTASRELHSLTSRDEQFYATLKKMIKSTNFMRDLDVFLELYLATLPIKYRAKLDMQSIIESITAIRSQEIEKLHTYVQSIVVPKSVVQKCEEIKLTALFEMNTLSIDNMAQLHKYRLQIKKRLNIEKNTFPSDEKKIKLLTKIKDLLGEIHDQSNGLARLKSYEVNDRLLKKIEKFTQKKNMKLFEKFQKSNNKYLELEKVKEDKMSIGK